MGERCACCLYLDREADKETLETIKEHLFIDFHEDWRMFYFEQVNFGDLPDEIAFHLIEKNISFVWLWERSFMWDAGVIIHDAEKRRCASLTRDANGDIVVPAIKAIKEPYLIEDAAEWQMKMQAIMECAKAA